MRRPTSSHAASVSCDVVGPTRNSGATPARQRNPMQRSGQTVISAKSAIEIDSLVVARTAFGLANLSKMLNSSSFTLDDTIQAVFTLLLLAVVVAAVLGAWGRVRRPRVR